MTNATTFGRQAAIYAAGRPNYPDSLFDWIAANSPHRDRVWDVATGSGQAAISLAERFGEVVATDIDVDQIHAAQSRENIHYRVAPARVSGLPDNSVDAVNIATALHWFADAPFWTEVGRVAKPGAVVCAYVYPLPRSTADVDQTLLGPLYAKLDPYWSAGNRLAMAGYTAENTQCPFPVIETPAFEAGGEWPLERLLAFARSWSAHLRAREDGHAEWLDDLEREAIARLGLDPVPVRLPLSVLAARVPG